MRAPVILVACIAAGSVVAGCSTETPPGPPGLRDSNGQVLTQTPSAPRVTPKPTPPAQPTPMPDLLGPSTPSDSLGNFPVEGAPPNALAPIGSATGAVAGSDAGPEDRPRDLARELSALLDPHGACLDFAAVAAAGGSLTLRADTSVLPSGRIMRASVSAPGQSADARSCIEQRLLAAQLASPVPGAPRSVSASLTIEVTAGQRTTATPGPERARPPNAPAAAELAKPDPGELARPDPGDVAGAP